MKIKLLSLFLTLVASVGFVFAQEDSHVKIGDLYYDLTGCYVEPGFPASVTRGPYVGLTSANIPSNVTYRERNYTVDAIKIQAFEGCSTLSSVTIPYTIDFIGDYAFNGCSINEVHFDGTIEHWVTKEWNTTKLSPHIYDPYGGWVKEYISYDLYIGGKKITKLDMPYSINFRFKKVPDCIFAGCRSLTSVKIPGCYESIGEHAFCYCKSLTSVTIPYSVTSIGYCAFADCSSLTSVTIPNFSVTSIGGDAFYGCSSLTSVTIPSSVTSIGSDAFYNVPNIEYHGPATGSPWGARSVNGYVDGYFVYPDASKTTLLACSAVAKGKVIIPNSVTNIGDNAFYECSSLTSVTIPNRVTNIGNGAFHGCSGLTSVTIGNGVKTIGDEAFSQCSNLNFITFKAATPPSLGDKVFDSTNDYPIYVPCNSVAAYKSAWSEYADRIVGDNCKSYTITFLTCDGTELQSLQVTENEMPEFTGATPELPEDEQFTYTFDGWYPAIGVAMADATYTAIYEATQKDTNFCGTNLTWDIINGVLTICGVGAMTDYYGITDPCKTLWYTPWYNSRSSIISTVIENGVTSIGNGAFRNCTTLSSINIPNSVTSIGNYAFSACLSLTSVALSNNVNIIGDFAFYKCSSLTSVTIPNSVTSIGNGAFEGCSSLISIYNYATEPQEVNDVFYGVNQSACTLYVPVESIEAYKTADVWKEFKQILPISAQTVDVTTTTVETTTNTADIAWQKVDNAYSYELVIKDKSGNIVCTLTFNANGQLTSIAFNAPARGDAPQQTQAAGFTFTVTGLDSGETYNYTLTAKDNNGTVLNTETGSFSTKAPQGIDEIQNDQVQRTKVLRDGQIFILRGEKVFTLQGQEVK